MKSGGLLLLVAAVMAAPLLAQPGAPAVDGSAARTVTVHFADYQRLVERRREIEERLSGGAGRALDAVIGRARYDVKLGADAAQVTARFDVKTLRADGWKLLPLVGGGVAVSRFEAPMKGAFLVTREMLPPGSGLAPGTQYLLAEGGESGELVLEFLVPVYADGGVRRVQFTPPAVPLSTLDLTVPESDVTVSAEPDARVEATTPGKGGEPRRYTVALRGGEPLTLTMARPETPVAGPPGRPSSAAPRPELAVDLLNAQWSLGDARIRLRERLVVDVRTVPVDRLVLRKPAALASLTIHEEVGSTLLEESSVGRALDPDGRQESVEVRLRAPVAGRLVKLTLTGELRADPDQPELTLTPVTVEGASSIVEGYASVSSALPHAVSLERAQGARSVPVERLPLAFAPLDGPLLVTTELTDPESSLTIKQQVLPRPHTLSGAIQKLDVFTDLSGTAIRTHYHALLSPGPDGGLTVTLPDSTWTIAEVRGTATSDIPTLRAGTYALRVKPGSPDPAPLDFEVRHGSDTLHGTGDATLALARFNVPARNVSWTVQEPDQVRLWAWRGSFAESQGTHELFLHRFALGIWSGAATAALGLLEPSSLFWLLMVIAGVMIARSAALGRLPLDASVGQLAFLAGIVVLGAVLVHVLTNAANPGAALSDARDGRTEAQLRPLVPAPAPHPVSSLDEARDPRHTLAEDTSSAPATRVDAAPVPQPAVPPPAPAPTVMAVPVMHDTAMRADPLPPLPVSPGAPATAAVASAVTEGRPSFTRPVVLPGESGLSLEATFIERRYEALATALAMLVGIALFLAGFFALRQWIDVPTLNVGAGLGLLVLWLLDSRYPFTAPFAAAGFGLPVLLLGSVKLMGHALDTWDAWREEGERFTSRGGGDTRTESSRSGSWSASFPRSGDRNEVPIKEIFTDPPPVASGGPTNGGSAPAAGSDEISFVSEDDEAESGEAPGGEPQ